MQHYQLVLLVSPKVSEADFPGFLDTIKQLLAARGAKLTKDEPLGHRRLAYPINKERQGTYHQLEFDVEQSKVSELDRELRLNKQVLRHLLVVAKVKTPEQLQREEAIRAKIEAKKQAAYAKSLEQKAETAPTKPAGAAPSSAPRPAPEPTQKVSLEELDEKLEQILEDDDVTK